MQTLQPVHPEQQKQQLMQRFAEKFEASNKLFTSEMAERTQGIINMLSVHQIENYPSKLLVKILPKINNKLKFLRAAHQFVVEEKVRRP
jgi:dynein heavy chain, axonemal